METKTTFQFIKTREQIIERARVKETKIFKKLVIALDAAQL